MVIPKEMVMEFPSVSQILGQAGFSATEHQQETVKMAKAELLSIAEEQERAWLSMRYALEELERRLLVVETQKLFFGDSLHAKVVNNAFGSSEHTTKTMYVQSMDSLLRYSSFYQSKIFEDRSAGNEVGNFPMRKLERQLTFVSEMPEEQVEQNWQREAQMLRAEVARLEGELRLATQEQVTTDILDDAPEELSDAASCSHALCSQGAGVPEILSLTSSSGELDFVSVIVGQLVSTFQMQPGSPQKPQVYFGEDEERKLGVFGVVIRLFMELTHQLAVLSKTVQGDLSEEIAAIPPWVGILQTAVAELQDYHDSGRPLLRVQSGMTADQHILNLQQELQTARNDLERALQQHTEEMQRKENTLKFAQELNSQVAVEFTKVETELADLRSQYKGLLASVEIQLKEAKLASAKGMQQNLAKNELKIAGLERMVADKDSQLQELRRRMHAIQSETDATVMEKFDLLQKLREVVKQTEGHKVRIKELVTINQEALQFAQTKEEEAAGLHRQLRSHDQSLQEKTDLCSKLTHELSEARRLLDAAAQEKEMDKFQQSSLKEQVAEMEYELRQREDALERLSKHLAAVVKDQDQDHDQDVIQENSLRYQYAILSNSQHKENKVRSPDQLRHSKVIIRHLEEKLGSMDSEFRNHMAEMKHMVPSPN